VIHYSVNYQWLQKQLPQISQSQADSILLLTTGVIDKGMEYFQSSKWSLQASREFAAVDSNDVLDDFDFGSMLHTENIDNKVAGVDSNHVLHNFDFDSSH
jgi:hypothetical protein